MSKPPAKRQRGGSRGRKPEVSYDLRRFAAPAPLPIDSRTARALEEAFPAPKPDVIRVRQVRNLSGGARRTIGIVLPPECAFVAGFRQGDQVAIQAWKDGVIRMIRLAEAEGSQD